MGARRKDRWTAVTVVEADVAVVGAGSVGSMASWQLASRGLRVVEGVVVAVGFSGHGFKMATSLGAAAADLIADGTTTTDVSFLDPMRFRGPRHTVAALPLAGTRP